MGEKLTRFRVQQRINSMIVNSSKSEDSFDTMLNHADRIEHAREMFEQYKKEEDEIRVDDFPGRIYVNKTLEVFRERKKWEDQYNLLLSELNSENNIKHGMSLYDSSKLLSLILRHKPEKIKITLDAHGWVNVETLLLALNKHGHSYDLTLLEKIVNENNKKRFSFNEDKTMIRANQGHSVEIDLNLPTSVPPLYLYHGTSIDRIESIKSKGILKGERHHVHLSTEIDTALSVGKRHGNPHFFVVNAKAMHNDGHKFYLSDNGVWLTDHVPSKYLN